MVALLYTGLFVCNFFNVLSNQKYARQSKNSSDFFVYALVTGVIATVVFYITSGYNINLNFKTVVYSIVFAIGIFINYFFSLAVFKFMGVAETTFIRSGMTLIFSAISGLVFFSENLTFGIGVQFFLVLLTMLALFLGRKDGTKAKTITGVGILLCIGGAVLAAFLGVITKSFASDTGVTDKNSFFFFTNVIIVAFALLSVIIGNKFSFKTIGKKFSAISRFGYFLIIINVLSSNIASLLQIEILRISDFILYTPLNSALGLLAGEAVAVFGAREKPRIIATILALSSVLVVLFF